MGAESKSAESKKPSLRMGIFGGAFDPPHLGHINLLRSASERFSLSRVFAVPAFKAPLKKPDPPFFAGRGPDLKSPSPRQRLKMLELALAPLPFAEIDDLEIRRGGTSFSWPAVESFSQKNPAWELFLIIGLDQLEIFDRWKSFRRILERANLIAASRPGKAFPKAASGFPAGLQPLVESCSEKGAKLQPPYKRVYFCPLNDMDVSSRQIRKRLALGLPISHLAPPPLAAYLWETGLYRPEPAESHSQRLSSRAELSARRLAEFCQKELEAKQAFDVKIFDLSRQGGGPASARLSSGRPFSAGVIASGQSARHVKALAESLRREVRRRFRLSPLGMEGLEEARWIALDYGDLAAHIFSAPAREFCRLDELWESFSL